MRWVGHALRVVALTVVFLVCAAMFYVISIMGDGKDTQQAQEYPTLAPYTAMEDGTISFSAADLSQAQSYAGVPLMTLSSGWYLTGGEVIQWEADGETMREVRLHYTQNNGTAQLSVSTITPRAYLYTLHEEGFLPTATQDYRMLDQQAACMALGDTIRLHVVLGDVVYQIEGDVGAQTIRTAAGLAVVKDD